MTKKEKIIISVGAIVGGWLLCGFSMTTAHGILLSTLLIIFGLLLSVGGFISLILTLKRPKK